MMSLVWQQATLASFVDDEYTNATFTASTLTAIQPKLAPNAASIDVTWNRAKGTWAASTYVLSKASDLKTGTVIYSGTDTAWTDRAGADSPAQAAVGFSAVAAGATHACGIARGVVYCWGSSLPGGLGLGAQTQAKVPTAVTGGDLAGKTATAITAGTDFTCAVAAGTAYCWGKGTNGQLGTGGQTSQTTPKQVANLSGVTGISAGASHTCALAGGKPYCWGQGSNGQLGDSGTSQKEVPVAVKTDGGLANRTIGTISAGGAHSCAVADGQAFCWGLNSSGQLGDTTTTQRTAPVAVDTTRVLMGRSVSAIATGGSHTCALADDKAFCWGLGTSGQLGNSSTSSSTTPVAVGGSTSFAEIASGATHSCAVTSGAVQCWGSGVGSAPVAFSGSTSGRDVIALSIGTDFACAVAANAPAACVGNGSSYQLGSNSTATTSTFADVTLTSAACPSGSVRLSGGGCSLVQGTDYSYKLGYTTGSWPAPDSDWTSVTTQTRPKVAPSADSRTSTSISLAWDAADEKGSAYDEYQLERATSSGGANATTLTITGGRSWTDRGGLAMTRKFTAVSSGAGHSCGIVSGDLYCWGLNDKGQLGVGDTSSRTVPTRVTGAMGGRTVTAVSAGTSHTCAIAEDKVYCWGTNGSGQVGDGGTTQQNTPVAVQASGVLSGKTVTAVSAGTAHSCVVASSRAYCWGANGNGQLGDGTGTTRTAPVAVSTTTGDLLTKGVTDIAAGGNHTCAVADSKAYCWGYNNNGQLGGNTLFGIINLSSTSPVAVTATGVLSGRTVTQVTAGDSHTCVVASQRAYCWGKDGSGQLGNGGGNGDSVNPVAVSTTVMSTDVSVVSAGSAHTCAVAGAKAYCWGADGSGQLGNGAASSSSSPVAVTANGALGSATVTSVTAGGTHGCAVGDPAAYCWGSGSDGRLGTRATTSSTVPLAVVADVRCASGSLALGDSTCSLAAGTTYYYRVTFTLDGTTRTGGAWTPLATS